MNDKRYIIEALSASIILIITLSTFYYPPYVKNFVNPILGPLGAASKYGVVNDTIYLSGLTDDVLVKYDSVGIPYIQAQNLLDLYYVFGFIQARDRLFQMDLSRRYAEGRLSELLGPGFLDVDKHYRVIGLNRVAREIYNMMDSSPRYRRILDYLNAFSKGINAYIDLAIKVHALPPEYYILGVKPQYWNAIDTLALWRLIGWGLSGGVRDLELLSFIEANGIDSIISMDLLNRSLNPPILGQFRVNNLYKPKNQVSKQFYNVSIDGLRNLIRKFNNNDFIIRNMLKIFPSNSWVISGKFTESGYPLLANDPHLSLQAPPVWYEAELILKGVEGVYGFTFPGIPFIIIGRNSHVAWGFTNVGADVIDYYYYSWWDGKYYYNGEWLTPNKTKESILIRFGDGYSVVDFVINSTVHGPLIEYDDVKYAVRWVGHEPTLDIVSLFEYNFASDIYDVISASKLFSVPPQNLVAADIYGNIFYEAAGLYPVRNASFIEWSGYKLINYGYLPFNGSSGEGDWLGYISYDELPHVLNPSVGYIVTANNRPVPTSYPYYLGWGWADRYRFDRIYRMIEEIIEDGFISLDDMMVIQNDVYSSDAEALLPLLLKLVDKNLLSERSLEAINFLKRWDYKMDTYAVEPSLYVSWIYMVHKMLWGDMAVRAGVGIGFIPLETTEYILKSAIRNELSDVKSKLIKRDIGDIVSHALNEAVDSLYKYFGENISNWVWGKILIYRFEHPMGNLFSWLNYPDQSGRGGLYTVSVASFEPSVYPYIANGGPSVRYIADMAPKNYGDMYGYSVLPGGNSGVVYNPHYLDQLSRWIHGEYYGFSIYTDLSNMVAFESELFFRGG